MKDLKRYLRHIALLLVFTLLLPTATPALNVAAAETAISYTVDMGDNAYMLIVETDSSRTAELYIDGVITQRSVYEFDTGEILYYDLSRNENSRSAWAFGRNQRPTETYHIDDFKVTLETEETVEVTQVPQARAIQISPDVTVDQAPDGGGDMSSENLVGSKFFTSYDEFYARYLYGYTGSYRFENDVWVFAVQTVITTVATALGIYFPVVEPYAKWTAKGVNVLIEELAVVDLFENYYWKYEFKQTSPTVWEFETVDEFVYMQQRKIGINSEYEEIWETTYVQDETEIEAIREDILTNPRYYY